MTIEQYEKLLDALEKNVVMHGCAINDILYDYDEKKCHILHIRAESRFFSNASNSLSNI